MKNFNLNSTENDQTAKDISFKEVVIIGNGPSGITLSYFLAGNWPYWNSTKISQHPDELLRARLKHADENVSLIEHNLHELAQGLEGRTTNPVSLLFDNLQHPGADLGLKLPCMLKFKYHKDKEIDHVVLGKDKPGGSWHRMDPNLRTLSLSTWMSLPNLNFDDWLAMQNVADDDAVDDSCQCNQNNKSSSCKRDDDDAHLNSSSDNLTTVKDRRKHSTHDGATISDEVKTRALVHHVAEYYADYVNLMKLNKFFRNDTIVVSIRPIKENEKCKFLSNDARWIVHGYDKTNKKPFSIACNKVVLANGGSDLPNRLGVKGESKSTSWLKYELPSLEYAIENKNAESIKKPILIVGAGLSAADAIIACRNAGVEVVHVYRGMGAGFMGLPEAFFPEYNSVYRMMRNPREKYDLYQAIPESTLKEIKTVNECHYVTVQKGNNEELTFEVSYCAILIGSRPNLSFISNVPSSSNNNNEYNNRLTINNNNENNSDNFAVRSLRRLKIFCEKCRHLNICFGRSRNQLLTSLIEDNNNNNLNFNKNCPQQQKTCECRRHTVTRKHEASGYGIGDDPRKPIDCKNNPIAVNKFTNELLNVPSGVFALGPLVGDNFVRFIAGGALSISSYILGEGR